MLPTFKLIRRVFYLVAINSGFTGDIFVGKWFMIENKTLGDCFSSL